MPFTIHPFVKKDGNCIAVDGVNIPSWRAVCSPQYDTSDKNIFKIKSCVDGDVTHFKITCGVVPLLAALTIGGQHFATTDVFTKVSGSVSTYDIVFFRGEISLPLYKLLLHELHVDIWIDDEILQCDLLYKCPELLLDTANDGKSVTVETSGCIITGLTLDPIQELCKVSVCPLLISKPTPSDFAIVFKDGMACYNWSDVAADERAIDLCPKYREI